MIELKVIACVKWDCSADAARDITNMVPCRTLGLSTELPYFLLLADTQPITVNLGDVVAKNKHGSVFVIGSDIADLLFEFGPCLTA